MKNEYEDQHFIRRVEALENELVLIERFEQEFGHDPLGGYEVVAGAQARELRRSQIIAELAELTRIKL